MRRSIAVRLVHFGTLRSALCIALASMLIKFALAQVGFVGIVKIPDVTYTVLVLMFGFAVAAATTFVQQQFDATEAAVEAVASDAGSILDTVNWIQVNDLALWKIDVFQGLERYLKSLLSEIAQTTYGSVTSHQLLQGLIAGRKKIATEESILLMSYYNSLTGNVSAVKLRLSQRLPSSLQRFLSMSVALLTVFALVDEGTGRLAIDLVSVGILVLLLSFSYLHIIDVDDVPGTRVGSMNVNLTSLQGAIRTAQDALE